ncbi:AAA ATPase midasin [Rhizina undulata]
MDCSACDHRLLSSDRVSDIPAKAAAVIARSTPASNDSYLNTLSALALSPAFTSLILTCYEPVFPDIVARWRGLASPEEAAAAFARVLPVVPYLADLAEEFLLPCSADGSRTFLSSISHLSPQSDAATVAAVPAAAAQDILLSLHRLLCFKRTPFISLVNPANLFPLLRHPNRAVRYLTIRILCIFLKAADHIQDELFNQYGVGDNSEEKVTGEWEGIEIDYGFLIILEGERLKRLSRDLEESRSLSTLSLVALEPRLIFSGDFSPHTADLCGVLTPRLRGPPSAATTIIDTPTTAKNINSIALALRSSQPLLITGHAGSGKTFLIHQIAQTLNILDTLVSIHLGDQTDAKLLIGAYTTTYTPGSFEWRPGVLTTAVREGRWVLVEDIDKAPVEVLSVLLPLMEHGELVVPSRGEKITAARGFRLMATMRTTSSTKSDHLTGNLLGNRLWNRVDIQTPSDQELHEIVNVKFPLLQAISPSFMNVYNTIRKLYSEPAFFAISKTSLGRQISPRDLFKWCTRINTLFTSAGVKTGTEALPEGLFDEIFMEAVDCFAGSLHTMDARRLVVGRIAEEMHVPPQRVELFLGGHIPGYSDSERILVVGRVRLKKRKDSEGLKRRRGFLGTQKRPFATTNHALRLLEQVGVAVSLAEPVLLVGETGTGKTTVVQQLADMLRFNLTVINLSQQTESGDLLGGYKPVDVRTLAVPLKEAFDDLFERTFSLKKNKRFLDVLNKCWGKQQWNRVITLWGEAVKMAEKFFASTSEEQQQDQDQSKRKRKLEQIDRPAFLAKWTKFAQDLSNLERQSSQVSKSFAFSFIEGSLVKAARNGDWVLLDEINLAAPDTLESIADLLKDGGNGSILLSEKGDIERIQAHPDFRIFGCMNPATDVGKRDLPSGLRSRFTELYVVSPDQDFGNLLAIVKEYLGHLTVGDERVCSDVAHLYMEAKKLAEQHRLVDGANQRPHFSMRTLTRTLSYVVEIANVYGLRRSLYEGFSMSFLTLLDRASEALLLPLIEKHILGNVKNFRSLISQIPKRPVDGVDYIQFRHYWMHQGAHAIKEQPHYIITPFVERNMLNLVRATATRRFPVLIQGPTSSGKTSMIEYLAMRTGHKFVRINNHEHTDLQEYLGTYISDNDGQLKFQEGVLVEALRKGHWIVLDELNLAPTDVLEALNRLLDDNRELLIPETQEVVRPHKDFMLFATQNPPGLYGGRKVLSRAFRNRFLELHFDDIPEEELETILRERCQIAPSYCGRIVAVYKELSLLRQSTRLFEQKNSFATLRDLFRWANREAVGYQQLADNGYMLLAERVRKADEKLAVKKVIEKVMKVKIDEAALYSPEATPEYQLYVNKEIDDIVWTKAMRRLYSLVAHAVRNNEPILLVGETGCGKTTVCQMLADAFGKNLLIVNAHQNTETGDIIGAQRPIRNRAAYKTQLVEDLATIFRDYCSRPNVMESEDGEADLSGLLEEYAAVDSSVIATIPDEMKARIQLNRMRINALFEWSDGSLIQAMREGQFFLLDEISLADDSVLERLNSVLEPKRGILLAEKGPEDGPIIASDGFQFLATMNPGGDYGKKELSPALRNRFTEIWVPSMSDFEDVLQIVMSKLKPFAVKYAGVIVKFAQWFSETYNFSSSASISLRNVLAWVKFVNLTSPGNPSFGLLHGAALVFIDGLGANPSAVLTTAAEDLVKEKERCIAKLSELVGEDLSLIYAQSFGVSVDEDILRLGEFSLARRPDAAADVSFNLTAPTTATNAMRVVRAMQLRKPILLEGSPGVGKTSLVSALAAASGNPLTRINLSEHTDLMDLFGSDVPVEGGQSGEFAWRDAPFLQAMKRGHWVLLDEMNLASQSVLEGLNACLDHRGEAYVAELDRTFTCHSDFAVFAAQNPHHQGGGRKGLPASFVNRFTVVYVDSLSTMDLQLIASRLYPNIPADDITKLIAFMVLLDREVAHKRSFGAHGGPWEFNLRDTLRWLGLLSSKRGLLAFQKPSEFVDIIVKQRFRTPEDRAKVDQLFSQVFGYAPPNRNLYHNLSKDWLQVGHALLPRRNRIQPTLAKDLSLLKRNLATMETIMTCVQNNMPCILVGPSGAGKSSIIKLLASIIGAELDEMALNSDIDTTDIVGGFEQVDISRKISALFQQFDQFLHGTTLQDILRSNSVAPNAVLRLFAYSQDSSGESEIQRLHRLLAELRNLGSITTVFPPFIQRCEELIAEAREATIARFEWVDGMLIRAIEEGKWLILDNANICSPSVLDRLNSLLEVNGFLIVNEHSDKNGDPKLVRPHSNFRLFLTMDPRHGELSRAMRNRGIEIFMDSATKMSEVSQGDDMELLALAKFTGSAGVESSTRVYQNITRFVNTASELPTFEILVKICFDYLPRDQFGLLSRWRDFITSQMPKLSSGQIVVIMDVLDILSKLRSHPCVQGSVEGFLEYISTGLCLETSYKEAQPMNPIRNTSLLSPAPNKHEIDPVPLANLYESAREIFLMRKVEEGILQRSTATRLAEMTFLERSASKNRMAGFGGSVGLPLFGFLSNIRAVLEEWLDGILSRNVADEPIEHILELVALWRDLIELSNTQNLNESVFHVYLALLENWSEKSGQRLSDGLVAKVNSALGVFKAPLRLTTGFSMEVMWNHLRPSVPSSIQGWDAYGQLKKIADRFDAVARRYSGSFETVVGLKRSLVDAIKAVLVSGYDVSDLIEELDKIIGKLESEQTQVEREPLFKDVFDYLLKFSTLRTSVPGGEERLYDTVLTMAHYSGRPTTGLLGYLGSGSDLCVSYEQALEDLWVYPGGEESAIGPQNLLRGQFIPEMLRTSQAAKQSVIGHLRQMDTELQALANQFILHTRDAGSDQLARLNLLLVAKMESFVLMHKDAYQEIDFETVIQKIQDLGLVFQGAGSGRYKGLANAISTIRGGPLKAVFDEHISHAAVALVKAAESSSRQDAVAFSGTAWTHYALACLKLYVPNCAFDPAMRPMVEHERYLKRKSQLVTEIEAENTFELTFTAQGSNFLTQQLGQRLNALGEEPPNSLIARPKESEMSQLQGEFSNLLQVVVRTNPHQRLLPSILERKANSDLEEALFQRNLSQLAQRLQNGYPVYKDMVDPILGFIYSLKLGLSMAAMNTDGSGTDSKALASFLTPAGILDSSIDSFGENQDELQLFRLWQFAVRCATEGYENVDKNSKDTMNGIFQKFFQNWKINMLRETERAAADSSLYRYRGEDENSEEQGFKEMFPNYEEEEPTPEGNKPGGYDYRELACQISSCHSAVYVTGDNSKFDLSSLLQRGIKTMLKAVGDGKVNIDPSLIESLLPAVVLSLKDTTDWVAGTAQTPKTYDFYTHENLEQAQTLVALIDKIRARMAYLAEVWPEHITLQDAVETCQQLLNAPNVTPVAKFLITVEKLHGILNEWQGVASSEYSAAEHYDALTKLIISWRRLELTTWPRLFDIEDEKCRSVANSWWFYAYENIIANPLQLLQDGQKLEDHVEQLVGTLASFISSSSVGEFSYRLQVLRVFEQHALKLAVDVLGMDLVRKSLHNFITYYSQYEPVCREILAGDRKKFEKEITDIVLLASWKDTNIIALRESARRSHHKLYKVVRKYRQALDQPVAPLVQGSMPDSIKEKSGDTCLDAIVEATIDLEVVKPIYEHTVSKWETRPARLIDLPGAVSMMQRVSRVPVDVSDAAGFMEKFSSSIISTIKELQSETPGVLTDENKEIVKHIKTRKRKAFTDALKELKQMGLKSNLSEALLQKQATLERIITSTDFLQADEVGVNAAGVDHYFLRTLEVVPKVRQSIKEHSQDLTGPDVARSVGFLEHLFSLNLTQRDSVASALRDLALLQSMTGKYCKLSDVKIQQPELYGNKEINPASFADVEKRFRWIPMVLSMILDVLKIHSQFSKVKYEKFEGFLEEWNIRAAKLHQRFKSRKPINGDIWEFSAKSLLEEARVSLQELQAGLNTIRNEAPEIGYLVTQLIPWTSGKILETVGDDTPHGASSAKNVDAALQSLCDLIFVALQKLKDVQSGYPSEEQDVGWLLKHQSISAASLKVLHMPTIAEKIRGVIASVTQLQPFTPQISQTIRALFAAYYPIVQEYANICYNVVQGSVSYHRSMCKATWLLATSAVTLLSKGFCMPAEKSDEPGESNGVETGTGLGEGEGMDDISKDIKADEDLSELVQEKDKEEKKEIEEEKDAVDIEDEMEGQMGDMKEKEDEENDKGSGDEEEDEMDEETGDVDDLDPTAVDEKLWDEKGDDDSKEKEGGDNMKNKENSRDDMDAKKENGKEGEKSEEKEGKEGDEEMDDSESEGEGADENDEVKPQDKEGADEHIPEVDTLDLPEGMELDADEKSDGEDDDMNMDDLSDVGDDEMKDDGKDEKQESFPELDTPEKEPGPGDSEEAQEEEEKDQEREIGDDSEKDEGGEDAEEEGEETPEEQHDNILRTQDEDTSKEAEETVPSDTQGVEGGDDQQDVKEQTSAQQESGQETKAGKPKGQGMDEAQPEEQTDGQAATKEADSAQEQSNNQEDNTEHDPSFRKVGDILEKWHRQRKQILDAKDDSDRPQLDNMELDDPEFEHLSSDDAAADTQALGAATEDQARALDDSMAIDSGVTESQEAFEDNSPQEDIGDTKDETAGTDEIEEAEQDDKQQPREGQVSRAGAMIGEVRDQAGGRERAAQDQMDLDTEMDDIPADPISEINAQSALTEFVSTRPREEARQLWQNYEQSTRDLAMGLCEQLRLILEPTLATKMRGDFRTGKRLNMKRIIPYIASQYKKDKIWMRRTKPSKRQYQVMIAVDDSKSMAESDSVGLAFETVALVAKALSQLEVGQISIVSFGETTRLIHPFEQPFTSEAGIKVFERFGFDQLKTNVKTLVETSMGIFESVKADSNADLWQLEIIISDGVCEDHETLRRLVRKAQEEKIMIVFVIVDSVRESSILEMNQVRFEAGAEGSMQLKMDRYLDSFPFGFYLVVSDIKELPGVLALALRQWLAEIVDATA